MSEREKVEAAVACFDGEAWAWFQWIEDHRPTQTWEELKALVSAWVGGNVFFIGEEIPAGEEKGQAASLPEPDEIGTIIDSHNCKEEPGKAEARGCAGKAGFRGTCNSIVGKF